MVKTINIEQKDSIKKSAQVLVGGGVLVFPTDTVYGIGCLPSEENILKLYKIKNRQNQPTAVLISPAILGSFSVDITELLDDEKLGEFVEGKLTIILDIKKTGLNLSVLILKDETIGIRMPNYAWLEQLIDEVGPIVATSANKAGQSTPKSFKELDLKVIEEADLTIGSEEALSGLASSIYNLETGEVLR